MYAHEERHTVIPAGSTGFDSTIVVARNEANTLRWGPAVTAALLKLDMAKYRLIYDNPHMPLRWALSGFFGADVVSVTLASKRGVVINSDVGIALERRI